MKKVLLIYSLYSLGLQVWEGIPFTIADSATLAIIANDCVINGGKKITFNLYISATQITSYPLKIS